MGVIRRRVEVVLRTVAAAAVVAWIVNAAVPRADGVVSVRGDELGDALPSWTRDASVGAVHVRLDTTPDAVTAAWLAAIRGAGTRLSWESDALVPVALETYPAADPAGGTIVLASVASTTSILSDALGPLDTLESNAATALRLASLVGEVTLTSGEQPARATIAGGRAPKRVYVAGAAGWEAKFVVAALEEAGWTVDARLFVAPGLDVAQGAGRAALDTSRHSAVILLDSAAAETVRGVEAFVRAGGGVVLAGDASRARRVAELIAWRAASRETAALGTLPGDTAWRGLSRVPMRLTSAGIALPLEVRSGTPVIVARRHHAGRVAGVGYDATWRWRMAGGENSVAEHRAWWSRLVSSVAARRPVIESDAITGAAPVAALHDVLGPPSAPGDTPAGGFPRSALANLLGLIALSALLGEWLLRRSRGAR